MMVEKEQIGQLLKRKLRKFVKNGDNVSYDLYDGTSYKNVDSQKFVIKLQCIVEK